MPSRELRFTWKNKDMEFQAWEVAHFRLLGDDRKLPYGTSMLDKVRRIWKQLLLAEDAMLIYRTSRAPERESLRYSWVTWMIKILGVRTTYLNKFKEIQSWTLKTVRLI